MVLAVAVAAIEYRYVRAQPDEDRWTENMFTIASRAEDLEDVHIWAITVQAWRFLKAIRVGHYILLGAVGLCVAIAAVRIAGGAIGLAVTLPFYYIFNHDEWGAYDPGHADTQSGS
jgi:hypothetical protein